MSKEELLKNIITSLVLEYRVSLDTIEEIFGKDKNEVYCDLMDTDNYLIKNAIMYVLDYETKEPGLVDQRKAKAKARSFMTRFQIAKTAKEKIDMLTQINDNSEIEMLRDKESEEITDEDMKKLIDYRYKYALSKPFLQNNFGVTVDKIRCSEDKQEESFRAKLKFLNNYNDKISHTKAFGKRQIGRK